jgi:adenine-specific DNA-methyltransferase
VKSENTMKKLTAADPETKSPDVQAENLAALRALFPELVTEGPDGVAVNLDVLKQLVGDRTVTDAEEKYGLNWHGKRRARQIALTPSTGTLRPCPEDSVEWATTQNLLIEGDNLEVLKLLQKSYAGRVKLIYIDPPYNTGKDFVYPDSFQENIKNYLELTGQSGDSGKKLSSNTETSGRFHTDWLNMMYPRLKLARSLLREDGVIFISIDDNEVDDLRMVCDETFGEENRIAIICHKARASVSNDKIISSNHNFILLYARNGNVIFDKRSTFGLPPELEGFDKKDARGAYKYVPVDGPGGAAKGNPYYTFMGVSGYWRFSEERMKRMYEEGRVEKVGGGLQQKYYLDDAKQSRKTDTTWWDEKLYTSTASARLKELMGGEAFDNPKPVELVERMLELWGRGDSDLVLDFFGGSGTTGHAVFAHNAKNNLSCKFIVVQLPEPLDPANKDQKEEADYCDKLGKPRNIAELTKERLRRSGKKIRKENPLFAGDLGFRVFKLSSSNIRAWEPDRNKLAATLEASIEHLKADRTEQDILFELLLKLGLDLCVPIETKKVEGAKKQKHELHSIGGGSLLACLSPAIPLADVEPLALGLVAWHKALRPAGETTVVFRDSAFADDVAKANLTAILQQNALETVRSL